MSPGFGLIFPSRLLTLTTDFGTRDHYVGVMKGVVASVAPLVRVVDICHEIPQFNISEGAFAIAQAFQYFPRGTVHVVVVDPGVGSGRRPLAAVAGGHYFVAPDNGVLSQVFAFAGEFTTREVDVLHGLDVLSQTFHGRDLFAPAGASLANGLPFRGIGPLVSDPVCQPPAKVVNGKGRVLHVDAFGNIVTSFRPHDLPEGKSLSIGGQAVSLRADSYASAPADSLFLIVGSSGYLEISLNQGSAAQALQARAGTDVVAVQERDATIRPDGQSGQSAKESV